MSCREVTEIVTEYLEGRLPRGQRLAFQWHLLLCRHCRRFLRQLRLTVALTGRLPPIELPDDVLEHLARRLSQPQS